MKTALMVSAGIAIGAGAVLYVNRIPPPHTPIVRVLGEETKPGTKVKGLRLDGVYRGEDHSILEGREVSFFVRFFEDGLLIITFTDTSEKLSALKESMIAGAPNNIPSAYSWTGKDGKDVSFRILTSKSPEQYTEWLGITDDSGITFNKSLSLTRTEGVTVRYQFVRFD